MSAFHGYSTNFPTIAPDPGILEQDERASDGGDERGVGRPIAGKRRVPLRLEGGGSVSALKQSVFSEYLRVTMYRVTQKNDENLLLT